MENVGQYIKEARLHGQTDEQIKTALLTVGWSHQQVSEALDNTFQPPKTYAGPKSHKKKILLASLIMAILLILAVGTYLLVSRKTTPQQQPSVTLYYNDGKTVLWQDKDPTGQPYPQSSSKAPYFVGIVLTDLQRSYGVDYWKQGVWKVTTTLNKGLQNDAEQDVKNNESNVASVGGDQEAMVAEDVKTGQVVSLVGGEDYTNPNYGQLNYALIKMSPGSSVMPFVYAALMQNNTDFGAGSVLDDSQQPLIGYPCTNKVAPSSNDEDGNCLWDNNFLYPGQVTLRYALGGVRNVPAVEASYSIVPGDTSLNKTQSVNKWINMANAAIGTKNAYGCYSPTGDTQQVQCYGTAALGSGEIPISEEVNGDATLARLGAEIPQTYTLSITKSGKAIYQWHQPQSIQVYDPDTAYIIDTILDDSRASYLQPEQKFQNYNGWDNAVQSGTENQAYGGIMTAWDTQYAVVGFAGSHDLGTPLEEGHSEDIAEPITKTWMEQALSALHTSPINWKAPSNVKTLPSYVQAVSPGYGAEVPGPTNDLYPSWYK